MEINSPSVAGAAAVAPAIGGRVAPAASAQPSADPAAASSPASALQAALGHAAALQGGLAPLFADLSTAMQSDAMPQGAVAAIQQVLELQLPLDPPPSADALKQAVAQSGLFLEARLAAGEDTGPDLKSALLKLADALSGQTGSAADAAPTPMPPYPDGPLLGQEAMMSDLAPGTPLQTLMGRLARRTRAALARQTLMQAASAGTAGRSAGARTGRAWMFELPLATPRGAAVAQFEIDEDERRDSDAAPVWRTRFSLNLAPSGPVHARLTLTGDRVRVALWAEEDGTLADLTDQQQDLRDALAAEALDAQVDIFPGAPGRPPPPPAGRFLDRKL